MNVNSKMVGVCEGCPKTLDHTGYHMKCLVCSNYDLCGECHLNGVTTMEHQVSHAQICIRTCTSSGWNIDRHLGVYCYGCKRQDFGGHRYKCLFCDDYDLCGPCYDRGVVHDDDDHKIDHPMQCILTRAASDLASKDERVNVILSHATSRNAHDAFRKAVAGPSITSSATIDAMERDFPYTPVTTLAGIRSLTELLLEMPLPTPIPHASYNKSLLFHPRVAEEANNLLETQEYSLIQQLIQSITQTTVDHIVLKERANTAESATVEPNTPQLLKAMLTECPTVFRGSAENSNALWNNAVPPNGGQLIANAYESPLPNISHTVANPNVTNVLNVNGTIAQMTDATTTSQQQYMPQTYLNTDNHNHVASTSMMMETQTNAQALPQDIYSSYHNLNANNDLSSALNKFMNDSLDMNVTQNDCNMFLNNTYLLIREQLMESAKASADQGKEFTNDGCMLNMALGDKYPDVAATWPMENLAMDFNIEKPLNSRFNEQPLVKNTMTNFNVDSLTNKRKTAINHHKDGSSTSSVGSSSVPAYENIMDGSIAQICAGEPNRSINAIVPSTNISEQMNHVAINTHMNAVGDYRWNRRNVTSQNHRDATDSNHGGQVSESFRRPSPAQASDAPMAHVPTSPYVGDQLPVSLATPNMPIAINRSTYVPAGVDPNAYHTKTTNGSSSNANPLPTNYSGHFSAVNTYASPVQSGPSTPVLQPHITAAVATSSVQKTDSAFNGPINSPTNQSSNAKHSNSMQLQNCVPVDGGSKPSIISNITLIPANLQNSNVTAGKSNTHDDNVFSKSIDENVTTDSATMDANNSTNQLELRDPLNGSANVDDARAQPLMASSGKTDNQPVVRLVRLENDVKMPTSTQTKDTPSITNGYCSEPEDSRRRERIKPTLTIDKDDEEITSILRGVRKRTYEQAAPKEEEVVIVSKPKLRKVERKFVPVLEKLSVEELMETNTYVRFNRSIEKSLDGIDESVLLEKREREIEIDDEEVISRYQLQDLCSEAAKLKSLGAMHMIPTERLVRLLCVLEYSIRAGQHISPVTDPDDSDDVRQMLLETSIDRVMCAVDASLISLYIMTSTGMPKRVYIEDVIDNVIMFIKYQLVNTIFPTFDVVYRVDTKRKDSGRKKRPQSGYQSRERNITQIYGKIHELVSLLAELLNHQTLTDTAVLHASSMGVCPFFVDNVSELQLSCLKLVTTIFTRYENHRRLLLDDILASIARLPSSKRGLRTYRLVSGGEEHIQMLTALVLQLIQCVVSLPETFGATKKDTKLKDDRDKDPLATNEKKIDKDVFIHNKFETARTIAGTFLTVFLSKCGNKNEEIDYRPLFENFVQDLLTTVNKPEWPAAELLLSLLGTMLVKNFSNKGCDAALRVASLEYLGVIAARLRKDAVTSRCKVQTIDQLIRDIRSEETKEMEENESIKQLNEQEIKPKFFNEDDERIHFLQRVLLDYLSMSGQKDQAHNHARHFYIVQWYRDILNEKKELANEKNEKVKKPKDDSDDSDSDDEPLDKRSKTQKPTNKLNEMYRSLDLRKEFLVNKIRPFHDSTSAAGKVQILQTYIDYTSADLISQYLASKRSFLQSFDKYLTQILLVLRETSIAIRTKAMKCLTAIVEADPSVLARSDMQLGVNHSLLDHSTSVREAAVDLIGKFVLSRPELIDKYYDMLLYRILDTGVSVRKRVIKILKDICIECPEFHKVPEICVKMIRRVNDEEGIRKLVMEVFQNMWFTPVKEKPTLDQKGLLRKVVNIIDVVAASKEVGTEWFEMLLASLFKPREDKEDATKVNHEPSKTLITACRQIVDCLIENVLFLEESSSGSSERLVACFSTLFLFAKIRAQLLVKHAITLQPYLSYKCQTREDNKIVTYVAMIMELVVPLIIHPSETFLAQLEEDTMKLIIQQERPVVASCIACLGSIVNNVTRNYKLIRDCFNKYLQNLWVYRDYYEKDPSADYLAKYKPCFRRSMFTIGLLLRHFDFVANDFNYDNFEEGLPSHRKDETFQLMLFYLSLPDNDTKTYTLKAIGSACVRHHELMRYKELSKAYIDMLLYGDTPLEIKMEVLKNIEVFLVEEDARLRKLDQEWNAVSKSENLKEMGDVSSGMASTIIQMYLDGVMQSYISPYQSIRHASLRVVQLVLEQGLVHPIQIVPYLICMSTDEDKVVFHTADRQLQDIEKKYPGFIHMRSMTGIQLSFELQQILQPEVVRGFRIKDDSPSALNGFLYSILRNTKQQRRAIVNYIVRQFDEEQVNLQKTRLEFLLYLTDNLAYFPFQVLDEPLYLINLIDKMVSNVGVNLLHSFKETLLPKTTAPPPEANTPIDIPPVPPPEIIPAFNDVQKLTGRKTVPDDDDDDDEDELFKRIPTNTTDLQMYMTSAQGCMLLLALRQHLKAMYGLTDSKIVQYSPTELAKVWEKAMNRKTCATFEPKEALQKLKDGRPSDELDDAGRRELIKQYMNFHQLMLKWDPEEDDEEKEKDRNAAIAQAMHTQPNSTIVQNHHVKTTPTSRAPPVSRPVHVNPVPRVNHVKQVTPTKMKVVDITMDDDDDDCQILDDVSPRAPKPTIPTSSRNGDDDGPRRSSLRNVRPLLKRKQQTMPSTPQRRPSKKKNHSSSDDTSEDDSDSDYSD